MRRFGVVGLVAGACILPAASPAAAQIDAPRVPASTAANSAQFVDPTGDAVSGGPDITTVNVSNDDAGTLRFAIATPSHPTFPALVGIGLFFDADRNTATGSGTGSDFRVLLDPEDRTSSFDTWNSSTREWNGVANVLISSVHSAGVWSLALRATGLGTISVFNFYVGSLVQQADGSRVFADTAPNSPWWTYEIRIGSQPPPDSNRVRVTGVVRTPSKPVAGQSFTIAVTVTRVGRPGRFNGVVYCSPLPGVQPRWFGSVGPGRAACRWDIPASAGGKLVRGSISVNESGGPVVTRRFALRVLSPSVRLVLPPDAVTTNPPQPEAGGPAGPKEFFYSLAVQVQRGTGAPRPITKGSVACRATIAGRAVPAHVNRVRGGRDVLCGWMIPYGSSGRTMAGSIVVTSEGKTLTHRFSRRVR